MIYATYISMKLGAGEKKQKQKPPETTDLVCQLDFFEK